MMAELDRVLNALADVVVRASPYGEDNDGFVSHYLSGTGAIHAAIPLLAEHGIIVRPGGFDSRTLPEGTTPALGQGSGVES